ncbi:MAG: DegV family protein [Dehalococcoidales bacterium]
MAIKIITDSLSDITSDRAADLGITVVPLTVIFGRETFLDRVTITTDEFYRRLADEDIWPTTTQPTPAAFVEIYEKLAKETDEILVITLSSKLSGTYQSALGAKDMVKTKARIEIIDSRLVAMGLGLTIISAVKKVNDGASMDEMVEFVNKAEDRTHFVVYFDTLKYLAKGGRIGKAQGLLGAMLSVKPILTVKDGEILPVTRLRSKAAGMDYLYNIAAATGSIEGLAVEHATTPDEADKLVERLGSLYPKEQIVKSIISPVLGVHGGPGAMAITVLESEK